MLAAAPRTVIDPNQLPLCQLSKKKKSPKVFWASFANGLLCMCARSSLGVVYLRVRRRVVNMYVCVIDMCFSKMCASLVLGHYRSTNSAELPLILPRESDGNLLILPWVTVPSRSSLV